MIPQKLLGLSALAAAASFAPAAFAAESGSLASLNLTVYADTGDATVDGLPVTKTVNLAGDTTTTLATCSGQVRKQIVGTGAAAIVTTATYDARGQQLSRRDATGAGTDYTYDALGRKLTEVDAAIAGKVRAYTYDLAGQLITATDPLGVVTTYGYDARGRKISESTPMNGAEVRLIRYGYDGRGHMVTLTDANGAVTTWTYDDAGRQTGKLYANGDHRSMAYDAAGRLITLTDENGATTTSVYDLASRLLTKSFSADNTTDTYAYDLASRMTAVTKGRYNHTLTYGYDQAGRVATETHPDGTVLHLTYDDANRLAELSLASSINSQPSTNNYTVAYGYDSRGLLSTVSSGDYATRYEYRANGQLASTIDHRVVDPQADILRTDRAYDAGARLLEVANTAANGDQAGVRYTLGLDDQRTEAVEENGQKWQYGYDSLKQLVTAKKTDTAASVVAPLDQSYTYDPMGNRRAYTEQGKSVAYTANSANQYTAIATSGSNGASSSLLPSSSSLAYDRNGNLLTDGDRTYTWDAENQLITVTPVSPAEGAKRVEYTYDWRMRRTAKKSYTYTNGAWALAATHDFKYHEWNPVQEQVTDFLTSPASPLTTTKSYVWGNDLSGDLHCAGGVGGLLSMAVSSLSPVTSQLSTDRYFYAYDGNGNVRALVKADSATPAASAVVERYAYDGFGRELAGSGPINSQLSPVNSFRFSTKYLESETGMNYYGYRFYAADAGRWINRDPIAELGGLNVYGMIGSSLIANVDNLGLIQIDTAGNTTIGSIYAAALEQIAKSTQSTSDIKKLIIAELDEKITEDFSCYCGDKPDGEEKAVQPAYDFQTESKQIDVMWGGSEGTWLFDYNVRMWGSFWVTGKATPTLVYQKCKAKDGTSYKLPKGYEVDLSEIKGNFYGNGVTIDKTSKIDPVEVLKGVIPFVIKKPKS